MLLDTLETSIELLIENTESVIILWVTLMVYEKVMYSDVALRTGFTPLIHASTLGNNTWDRLFVS